MNTEYKVTLLSREDIEAFPDSNLDGPTWNLVTIILNRMAEESRDIYLVEWNSASRVPIGAILGNYKLGWTQHGIARSSRGEMIGTYERLKDQSGENHNENAMLIAVLRHVASR